MIENFSFFFAKVIKNKLIKKGAQWAPLRLTKIIAIYLNVPILALTSTVVILLIKQIPITGQVVLVDI